jgi:protein-tyrosine phosphatase
LLHAILFTLLAGILAFHALDQGGLALLLLWPALAFALLAGAYAGLGPAVFGKRENGRLPWWAILLLLPCLLLLWGLWHLQRRLSREPVCNEIAPGLWVGRRPFPRELPGGVGLVVDLTAEFPTACPAIPGREYRCLPILDASVPDERAFRRLVDELADRPGVVYLHCAQGHGRSGMVAAALLLARGLAADANEAVKMVRRARPGARLGNNQRRVLERLFGSHSREANHA